MTKEIFPVRTYKYLKGSEKCPKEDLKEHRLGLTTGNFKLCPKENLSQDFFAEL